MRSIFSVFALFWVGYSAYTFWAYANVFPVTTAGIREGSGELSLPTLPFDTYSVSFLIHSGEAAGSLPDIQSIRQRNSAQPIVFSLAVLNRGVKKSSYSGSTADWFVGERHAFSASMNFDGVFQLFSSGSIPIEFSGSPITRYTLRYDVTDIGGIAQEYPVTLFVAGNRDNGYYPLRPILVVIGSALVLFATIIVRTLLNRSYGRK